MKRHSGRAFEQLRDITIEPHVSNYAEGSCIIRAGNTHVICTASVEERVPPFLKGQNSGWVTAEYSMLPRSTQTRMRREITQGKPSGRTQEIQRLIGRSFRAITDLTILGERQIVVDCDVIQADGGTRTASITGGYVALYLACKSLVNDKRIPTMPLKDQIIAISSGIVAGKPMLDLDYVEDSSATVDANFVLTKLGRIVEIQATGEEYAFSEEQFTDMLGLAKNSVAELAKQQQIAIDKALKDFQAA